MSFSSISLFFAILGVLVFILLLAVIAALVWFIWPVLKRLDQASKPAKDD